MVKLSEIQKPKNIVQFSNKKLFIKRFCANGTFVSNEVIPSEQAVTFDNGEDFSFFAEGDFESNEDEMKEFEDAILLMELNKTPISMKMFSIDLDKMISYKQFSVKLKDYIKERTLPSRQVFLRRLRQVISYINKTPEEKLSQTLIYAIQFLKEYIEFFISSSVSKGITENFSMALGLNRFIPNKSVIRDLQKVLRKVSTELSSNGTISKITQTKIQDAYKEVFKGLLEGIATKVKNPMKKELLQSAIEGIGSTQGENDESTLEEEV